PDLASGRKHAPTVRHRQALVFARALRYLVCYMMTCRGKLSVRLIVRTYLILRWTPVSAYGIAHSDTPMMSVDTDDNLISVCLSGFSEPLHLMGATTGQIQSSRVQSRSWRMSIGCTSDAQNAPWLSLASRTASSLSSPNEK